MTKKLIVSKDSTYKDIFSLLLLFSAIGFFVGGVVAMLIWFFHGILIGPFGMHDLPIFPFAVLFCILGFVMGIVIVVAQLINIKYLVSGLLIFAVMSIILFVIWGTIEFEKIMSNLYAFNDELLKTYPRSAYIFYLMPFPFAFYLALHIYRKGNESEAILRFILYGLGLLLVLAAIAFDLLGH